jgi:integrase
MTIRNPNHPKKGSKIKVEPIRTVTAIKRIKRLLADDPRNHCLFTLGINTAFRAGDLLSIRVSDVMHLKPGGELELKETKTGKHRRVTLNRPCIQSVKKWLDWAELDADDHLFLGKRGLIRVQTVNNLVKGWCREIDLPGNYGSHSLRKTWGYMQRKRFKTPLPLLMEAFGHSNQRQTLAYLGIQDVEIKRLYRNEL